MTLILVRGLPGSGKSTYVRTNFPDLFHIEQDKACMVDGEYKWDAGRVARRALFCHELVESILFNGCDCVVSNTFTQMKELRRYLEIAKQFKANVKIITLKTQFKNTHNVPIETLVKMKNRWEDVDGETIIA